MDMPNYAMVDGIKRNISKRSYCVECRSYGPSHTSHRYRCLCGEINPKKFYGKKKHICASCHNKYTKELGKDKKNYVVSNLGGKCVVCGFNKFNSALDVHHLDPSIKEASMRRMLGWSKKNIDKEIETCVLMCSNCHRGVHSGDIKYEA